MKLIDRHMERPADHTVPTSTELAETRTALACERTLMAWIRTSLGLISFGFSIHKFMSVLDPHKTRSPRYLGIVLSAMGTAALLAGTIQYARTLHSMEGRRPGFVFYFACGGIALGLLVFAGMALRLGPFD